MENLITPSTIAIKYNYSVGHARRLVAKVKEAKGTNRVTEKDFFEVHKWSTNN